MILDFQPYQGHRRKLVLAFDVGTTLSSTSYCVLEPGLVPEGKDVTSFPAQELISESSMIPTVLYYGTEGHVNAVGAEVLQEGIFEQAEQEGWVKAEWRITHGNNRFMLHICPKGRENTTITQNIPPLPPGKTVVQVLADYIFYLYNCVKSHIKNTHPNRANLWASFESHETEIVLSHPNTWDEWQQAQMREAVALAKLARVDNAVPENVHLISEGEANLWFALKHCLLPENTMEGGARVVIVDAGRCTIDISTYQKRVGDVKFEEVSAPKCHFNGSIFVGIRARLYIEALLKDSDYIKDLDRILRYFDQKTLLCFSNDKEPEFLTFGSTHDKDIRVGIRGGQLRLLGKEVAKVFEPSIECIVSAVEEETDGVTHVELQRRLGHRGLWVVRSSRNANVSQKLIVSALLRAECEGSTWYMQ
ncbi:hypothetical protein DFP72DRAFT_885432 [Ephemerocybe angulata]|uniref:Uncharacterized protein n=1 Tax=Ephemerocybe angulata TaxID=980116 RepID=A0A8H6MC01_9AGAR|nr:hypothetical protein DFP72DRAFT_885432 [Tulosesus angulatus]